MGEEVPVCVCMSLGVEYDRHYFMHVGNFSTTENIQVKTMDASFYSSSPGPDLWQYNPREGDITY